MALIEFKQIINVVNFGLDDDLNWFLLDFMDSDTLSRLPLLDFQIDQLADRLNWDIMSSKELAGWIFVKYKDNIDWQAFLTNKHPKEINYLLSVEDKLQANRSVFDNYYIKKLYYDSNFISAFPWLIDWHWYAKNMQIPDYVLLRHWNKFNINRISKYQRLSRNVISKKCTQINWTLAARHPLPQDILHSIVEYVNFKTLCRYQRLTEEFIEKYIERIKHDKSCVELLCRYQQLSEEFILKHHKWLNLSIVSKYQDLSVEFIKQNRALVNIPSLAENKNYNKPDTVQILKSQNRWYIIDAPIINQDSSGIMYCNINYFIE
jgi:hypothetical protein